MSSIAIYTEHLAFLGTVHFFWGRIWVLVGFGKHHLKIAWPPLACQFFHACPLIAVIFLDDPSTKKFNRPSRFYLFLIFSIIPLLDVIVLTMKTKLTIHILLFCCNQCLTITFTLLFAFILRSEGLAAPIFKARTGSRFTNEIAFSIIQWFWHKIKIPGSPESKHRLYC